MNTQKLNSAITENHSDKNCPMTIQSRLKMFGASATDFAATENKTTEFFPISSLKNPYVLLSLE